MVESILVSHEESVLFWHAWLKPSVNTNQFGSYIDKVASIISQVARGCGNERVIETNRAELLGKLRTGAQGEIELMQDTTGKDVLPEYFKVLLWVKYGGITFTVVCDELDNLYATKLCLRWIAAAVLSNLRTPTDAVNEIRRRPTLFTAAHLAILPASIPIAITPTGRDAALHNVDKALAKQQCSY